MDLYFKAKASAPRTSHFALTLLHFFFYFTFFQLFYNVLCGYLMTYLLGVWKAPFFSPLMVFFSRHTQNAVISAFLDKSEWNISIQNFMRSVLTWRQADPGV